jgi:PD-(D/E)XK endonuclease
MEHPKDVGDRTTLAVMLALRELGYAVFVPLGENTRYDLVIDEGSAHKRVQCKTGRMRGGAVRWSVCSNYYHHPNPRFGSRDYHGEIDYFGVYCPETERVYLVPIGDLPVRRRASLRVEPARNSQQKFIRHAHSYEIGRVAVHASDPLLRLSGVHEVVSRNGDNPGQFGLEPG